MKPQRTASLAVFLLFLTAFLLSWTTEVAAQAAGSAPPGLSVAAERSQSVFNREETERLRRETHGWLVSERVRVALQSQFMVEFSDVEKAVVDFPERVELPVKVGLTRELHQRIRFDDLNASRLPRSAQRREVGAFQGMPDGGYVYTLWLSSPGAAGLRVHFTDFWLPPAAELFLYSEDGQVYGPYMGKGPLGDGDFWSHTVMGEEAFLQLRHHGPVTAEALADTWFVVSGLGHVRPVFMAAPEPAANDFCSYNEPCVENADCYADAAVDDAKNAVAHMQWIQGPFIYMCTGGLIADSDTTSEIPYFLSANHCISRSKDAASLENFFQLTVSCGTTNCDDVRDHRANHPQSLRTLGAVIKATSKTSDFTLFQLSQAAPGGSTLLGWTTTPVANSGGTGLYRISHPAGAPQAYSEHVVDTSAGTCSSWPRGAWIYSRDTYGATEGGSSGSPVVNAAGQVVGQLSGACGTNVYEVCDSVSNATVDGAFANYYDLVAPFLGEGCVPTTEVCDDGADNDCDGDIDCADADCTNHPTCTTCVPFPEVCDDGVDNDCDGLTDGADPDCNTCLPRGEVCGSDAQCCSGKCHPRKGTCN